MARNRPERIKRPTFWTTRIIDAAYQLALLGATEVQMGQILGVSTPTIKSWKQKHPEFDQAIKDGTIGAVTKVADAFLKVALGYEREIETTTYDRSEHRWITTKQMHYYPPDPWACARFLELKARNYDWSVTQNIQINQTNTNINIELSELSTDQLRVLKEISQKQLPQDAGSDIN